MSVICPTITAYTGDEYHRQMERIAGFAERVHIDLTDGRFANQQTVAPKDAWWPVGVKADFHIMYQDPTPAVRTIMEHKPNLVIIHAEAEGDFESLADHCHRYGVKVGVALLPETDPSKILPSLEWIDHVLIFSGNLGHQGGSHADLRLASRAKLVREHKHNLEIGWDGGVNDQNVASLVSHGIDVINVGGYLQSAEQPEKTYTALARIAEETGTT
ncbi:MAG TPA: hypothetical protein VFW90_02375 [Candidatus Saccharimonadales bacterium]|nr:hypothetical protein [Candidatus Saccharimonadales bacterium]